jgi:hypothetical protein
MDDSRPKDPVVEIPFRPRSTPVVEDGKAPVRLRAAFTRAPRPTLVLEILPTGRPVSAPLVAPRAVHDLWLPAMLRQDNEAVRSGGLRRRAHARLRAAQRPARAGDPAKRGAADPVGDGSLPRDDAEAGGSLGSATGSSEARP